MKTCKANMKTLWMFGSIILMILLPITQTNGYSLWWLRNTEFSSDLSGWFTAYENPWSSTPPNPTPTFGTVQWSSSNGGSARLAVSGSPGVADLISWINTYLLPGDSVICRVTTGTMSAATFHVQIGGNWVDFNQSVSTTQSNTTTNLVIVANKMYPPGTSVLLHLVCWPGSGEAWVQYVRFGRGGTNLTDVSEEQTPMLPMQPNNSLLQYPTPNPAKHNVQIAYTITQKGPANIRIFDVNGRLVKDFGEQNLTPGEHSVVWDCTDINGRKVPNDVYFYELKINGESYTKKSVIVR